MNTKRCGLWILTIIVISTLNMTIIPALVTAQDNNSVQYDQVVIDEITSDTPEIRYTFTGNAGDSIIVSMSSGDFRLNCYLELLDPDGQLLYTDDDWRWTWASPVTTLQF